MGVVKLCPPHTETHLYIVTHSQPHSMASIPDSVTSLSDDELRAALVAIGINPGPIGPTTRDLYRRKLAGVTPTPHWEEVPDTDEEEEEDEVDYQPSATVKRTPPSGLRYRTVRNETAARDYPKQKEVEFEQEEEEKRPVVSTIGSLCSLLVTVTKSLVLLGTAAVAYTLFASNTEVDQIEELRKIQIPSAPEEGMV